MRRRNVKYVWHYEFYVDPQDVLEQRDRFPGATTWDELFRADIKSSSPSEMDCGVMTEEVEMNDDEFTGPLPELEEED